ncbi:MAG: nucleotidyltransferase domain-containing protein [Micrococcales bacterium]|nr:nucleotidyltransferase domain-containing protein [Micrococcales bacterium]
MVLPVDQDRLRTVCERYGVARLDVFGSVARGTAGSDSDIDLLYTLAPDALLGWEIEDLEAELGEILGRPVDLVARRSLNALIRADVLQEAQLLHEVA